jgi:hypothetical protein
LAGELGKINEEEYNDHPKTLKIHLKYITPFFEIEEL